MEVLREFQLEYVHKQMKVYDLTDGVANLIMWRRKE